MLKNKLTLGFALIIVLCQAASLYAVKPRFSTHQSKGKFERGKLDNVSILDKGIITLAPQTEKVMETGDPFIWSVVTDNKDNVYVGTGNDGKIYRYSASGDSSVWFDSKELEIYTMTIDKNNNIYAGTSPRGKVYKITPDGVSTVFFDPDDDYIWDLEFDKNGILYVATGASATIYKVTPDGKSSLFFAGDQTHIKSMFIYGDIVYAGSSGNGYVYKITKDGKSFVILDTQMQEVHDLIVSKVGIVYAAAYGEALVPMPGQKDPQSGAGKSDDEDDEDDEEGSFAQSFLLENMRQTIKTPTALYRIDQSGYAKDLWIGSDERVQVLLEDHNGDILAGTGNEGKLYRLNNAGKPSLILTIDESQITALAPDHKSKMVIGTSNLGTLYFVMLKNVKSASYESEVIDTGLLSIWGSLDWEGKENNGNLDFYTRSGNTEIPELTWSDWQKTTEKNGILQIASPSARFIQWKCEFKGKSSGQSPELHKVTIAYMQKNLPPSITDIIIHRPGDAFDITTSSDQQEKGIPYPQQAGKEMSKTGFRSIDWLFEDPNFDGLIFDLYYTKTGAKNWSPLVKDYANSYYSWDSRQMSDGEYKIKIIAKDILANNPQYALTGEQICDPFIIDNTGPNIEPGKLSDNKMLLTIRDKWNPVRLVSYSINAGNWVRLDPIDMINDSRIEEYEIPVSDDAFEIAIKAEDSVGNISVSHKIL